MGSCIGIVCARTGSKRLKKKNFLIYNGLTLADHAANTLSNSKHIDKEEVYISTDSPERVSWNKVIHGPDWLYCDNTPLQEAATWVYKHVDNKKFIIVILMPTAPFINPSHIDNAIELLLKSNMNIVRSYNLNGEENGLYVIKREYLLDNYSNYTYDVYTGAIIIPGNEIHTIKDYVDAKAL